MIHHEDQLYRRFQEVFQGEPSVAARAPGRVEFIGNHTDYNGGLVMGLAVEQGVTVLARLREDRAVKCVSIQQPKLVESSLDGLKPLTGEAAWANYPLGVIQAMMDQGAELSRGVEILVDSDLPTGAGMSSSAALELATAYALAKLCGFSTDKLGFARIGRLAENNFVGVPCGILDQGVVAFGALGSLVRIDCANEVFTTLPLGEGLNIWIFNTAKKHSLVDSFYSERNAECMEAARLLAENKPQATCLADFSEEAVRSAEAKLGPVLFKRALHVVTEIARVREVEAALGRNDLQQVGACLFSSHESSRTLFENSIPELDTLVALLRERTGVLGARLTGGGFGGAVMALTTEAFTSAEADAVAESYQQVYGDLPDILKTRAAAGAHLIE